MPIPAKPCSVIGVSYTRLSPNSSSKPWVTLYAPWYSATSSPITNTLLSVLISSAIAFLKASLTVIKLELASIEIGLSFVGLDGIFSFSKYGLSAIFLILAWGDSFVSTNKAIGVLTFTPSVPSATNNRPILPSSTASTSIVALSVSISAIKSPDEIESPSFTSHFDKVPSSIVGLRAGINISIVIKAPLINSYIRK